MIAAARAATTEGGKGGFNVVERCGAGHSPFLSMPEWVAGVVARAAASEA